MSANTGALARLLKQARFRMRVIPSDPDFGETVQARKTIETLAPETCKLAIDMAAWVQAVLDSESRDPYGEALLARFAALEERAAQ